MYYEVHSKYVADAFYSNTINLLQKLVHDGRDSSKRPLNHGIQNLCLATLPHTTATTAPFLCRSLPLLSML